MDVGASFNRALERFKPHAVTLVIGALAVWVINIVVGAIAGVLVVALGGGVVASIVGAAISAAFSMAVGGILWGGLWTMVGKAYMGVKPELGDLAIATKGGRLMEFVTVGAVIASPALLGIIPFVGGLLTAVGNIATYFLFVPALIMVAEGSDAKSALGRSKELTTANAKTFAIAYIVGSLISIFVITIPLGLLLILDTYFAVKNPQPAAGIQPMQQDYQQPGGYPPSGGGYPQG